MLRFKLWILYVLISTNSLLITLPIYAEVLDLGASEIQSKKDAPEAMTFISRAPLDESKEVIRFNGKAKIKEEIKTSRLFDLVY